MRKKEIILGLLLISTAPLAYYGMNKYPEKKMEITVGIAVVGALALIIAGTQAIKK